MMMDMDERNFSYSIINGRISDFGYALEIKCNQ